ncbi:MAG: type II toxin-antitoxin system RelE/ParE family toxin [Pseudomonadota bacterium]
MVFQSGCKGCRQGHNGNARLENGNVSNAKSVGGGIYECKINFGPGYQVYFAYDGKTIIILLAGGRKSRQSKDIQVAKDRWLNYKARK